MTKARTNGTPTGTKDRPEAIRRAVDEMGALLVEKTKARDRIRALVRRVQRELGIPSGDFVMGVRLHSLAEQRKQRTVDNIREIMFALGNSLPSIAPPNHPVTSPPVNKRDLIIQVLTTHGSMTAAELETRLGGRITVSPHLSQLKNLGRVEHRGTQWSVRR